MSYPFTASKPGKSAYKVSIAVLLLSITLASAADKKSFDIMAKQTCHKPRQCLGPFSEEQDCTAYSADCTGTACYMQDWIVRLHSKIFDVMKSFGRARVFMQVHLLHFNWFGNHSCLQMEYPEHWPTFFHDLIGTLSEGPDAVDMFCRVLTAVDQDIVSREIARQELKAFKPYQADLVEIPEP